MALLYEDDFNRIETDGIGRSSDYILDYGDASDSSVNGSEAVVIPSGSNWWIWDGAPTTHGYYYFDFYVPTDVDGSSYYEIDTKATESFYATYVYVYATGGDGEWEAWARGDPDFAEIHFFPEGDTWYRMGCHLDVSEEMVRLKIWKRDDPQPVGWGSEVTISPDADPENWTPWLGIDAANSYPSMLDNLVVSDVPLYVSPVFSLDAVVDGDVVTETVDLDAVIIGTVEGSFSLDALIGVVTDYADADAVIKRTIQPPYEPTPDAPTYINTSEFAGYGNTLTVTLPSGIQDGDLIVAAVSTDLEGNPFYYVEFESVLWPPGDPLAFDIWALSAGDDLGNADQGLTIWEMTYRTGMPTSYDITSYWNGVVPTTKAVALMAFRGTTWAEAGFVLDHVAGIVNDTYVTSGHTIGGYEVFPSELVGRRVIYLGIWAGAGFGSRSWSIHPDDPPSGREPMTQIANVSADNWASVAASYWYDTGTAISQRTMVPDAAEPRLMWLLSIRSPVTWFDLSARIIPGFTMDALIRALSHTTHPRTGPHSGVTPDTAIVSTATLGALPAGTDLNTVLRDIDALLTDLENKA